MSYMRKVLLRGWIEGLAAILVWIAAAYVAQWLMGRLESPEESVWTLAIPLLPIAGLAGIIWVTVRDLRRRDEGEQRCYGLAAVVTLLALLAFAVIHRLYSPLVTLPELSLLGLVVGAWVFWVTSFEVIRRFLL